MLSLLQKESVCSRAKWEGLLSEISILRIHFIIPNALINVFLFCNFSLSHFILILSLLVAFYALIGIFMKHFANSDHFTGTTQRDGMGREEGGGFRMGNTCIPVADSF